MKGKHPPKEKPSSKGKKSPVKKASDKEKKPPVKGKKPHVKERNASGKYQCLKNGNFLCHKYSEKEEVRLLNICREHGNAWKSITPKWNRITEQNMTDSQLRNKLARLQKNLGFGKIYKKRQFYGIDLDQMIVDIEDLKQLEGLKVSDFEDIIEM